ncbi:imidazole glycerol phosphate synthase subunit HisH [Chitinophaga lutea]
MSIVIVDYGMGNVGSIKNMLKRIGVESVVSGDVESIMSAGKLIIPGVGAFDHGMRLLADSGLLPILNERVLEKKVPVLGICLGMQLMGSASEEGAAAGLGWIPATSRRFVVPPESGLKVPHMGWNHIRPGQDSPLFKGLDNQSRFYFVHSYQVVCERAEDVAATASYGNEFCCSFARGNIFGVQFHPEKSHKFGMLLFQNFVEL